MNLLVFHATFIFQYALKRSENLYPGFLMFLRDIEREQLHEMV